MSGNDEKISEPIVCPYCGSKKFVMHSFGYCTEYINTENEDYIFGDWESNDSDGWQCEACDRNPTDELYTKLDELHWRLMN